MKNRVLFQGDSITDADRSRANTGANSNVALGCGYAYLCAARLLSRQPTAGLEIFNRGISGNRILDLYARWKGDVLAIQPGVLSILIGVNDSWHDFNSGTGVDVPRYAKTYAELLEWTREALPDTKLVLCEPFVLHCGAVGAEWVPEMRERGRIVRDLAGKFGAVFVPFQSMFDAAVSEAPSEYWLPDGVHPSPAGHERMAQLWMERTESLF